MTTEQPFSLVIFGASGDLARRKLIPALWSLYAARTLPEPFAIIGTGRTELTDEEFRTRMRDAVTEFARSQPPSEAVWERFASALTYVAADPTELEAFPRLDAALRAIEDRRGGPRNRLFYCATPPSLYEIGRASCRERV